MLRKKEEEKIIQDLKNSIKNKLESGFKNRKGQLIDSVDYVQIMALEIDEENDDRDKIIIKKVEVGARAWAIFSQDSKSSDNISLRNQKSVEFIYDKETDNFNLNEETFDFFDNTTH